MVDTIGSIGPEFKPVEASPVRERAAPEFGGAASPPDVSFKDVLAKSIQEVSALQKEADAAIAEVATGAREDYAGVINAVRKTEIAFNTLMQVRSKLIEAYQEFSRMRV